MSSSEFGDEDEEEEQTTRLHMKHFFFEVAALEVFTVPRL
jgi:hypothetical protein